MARPAADGGIEVLLVERGAQLRFMGGMHVFPGGAVHASDADAAIASRLLTEARPWLGPDSDPLAAPLRDDRMEQRELTALDDMLAAAPARRVGPIPSAEPFQGTPNPSSRTGAAERQRAHAGPAVQRASGSAEPDPSGRTAMARAVEAMEAADRDRAFAVAAIRETCEEVGVLLGVGEITASKLAIARQLLTEDPAATAEVGRPVDAAERTSGPASLARVLESIDASLDLSVLVPLSRWITPTGNPVRFDTRFYVAIAPSSQDASADGTEIHSLVWYSPSRAIEAHHAGRLRLSPPTRSTLQELVGLSSLTQLLDYAASRPAPCIEPSLRRPMIER